MEKESLLVTFAPIQEITIETDEYCRKYALATEAARAVGEILLSGSTESGSGSQPENRIGWSPKLQSEGYVQHRFTEVESVLRHAYGKYPHQNSTEISFYKELFVETIRWFK